MTSKTARSAGLGVETVVKGTVQGTAAKLTTYSSTARNIWPVELKLEEVGLSGTEESLAVG